MNTTEIWVLINSEWRLLDTFGDEVISLNYNLADIQDISSRNSSFSKTIILPDSKNNRKAFEYISELTADSLFNQNLKSECFVLVNGLKAFEGNLQLKNFKTDYVDGNNSFEVVIFNQVDTFIRNLGESYLNELDFSYLNHVWNSANIIASWQNNSGYFYPLIDYGRNYTLVNIGNFLPGNIWIDPNTGAKVEDMRPAIFVKDVVDTIFRNSGFTYKSNFFNSDYFKSLIVPHYGGELLQGEEVFDNNFRVEFLTSGTWSNINPTDGFNYRLNFSDVLFNPEGVYQAGPTYSYVQPDLVFAQSFGSEIIVNILVGSVSSASINNGILTATVSYTYDPNGVPDYANPSGNYLWQNDFRLKFNKDFYNPIDGTNYSNSIVPIDGGTYGLFMSNYKGTDLFKTRWSEISNTNVGGINYEARLQCDWTYTRPGSQREFVIIGNQLWASFSCTITSDELDSRTNPTNPTKYLALYNNLLSFQADRVDVQINLSYNNTLVNGPGYFDVIFIDNFNILNVNKETSFYNIISSKLLPDGIMNMRTVFNKKSKQKDFIKGLITIFNLFVEPQKGNNKILIVEPRDAFYSNGETIDWTEKIDLSSINTTFLSDFQSKKQTLTYKEDGDYLNTEYKKQTDEVYGEYVQEFDNDFVVDENKIETSFSPTPIIALPTNEGYSGWPMSRISKDENGGTFESNTRILFKNYILATVPDVKNYWNLWQTILEGSDQQVQYSIPWAGHLDNPFNPEFDLNFGQIFTSSYNWDAVNKTSEYLWWRDFFALINDTNGRYMEANFFLNETDISNFNFANKVYLELNGQPCLFIVNKIIDYNPSDNSLTKVELIKIN